MPGETKLTAKQELFVKEYLIDLNATQAAIRAGYSEKTAEVIACENLRKPNIAKAIQAAMDKRASKLEITAEKVLAEIAKLGFSNMQNIYGEDGSLLPVPELEPDVAAALQEVTEDRLGGSGKDDGIVTRRKYKLSDKKSSLELLGRHLKLFTDKIDVNLNTVVRKKKRFDGE
jgi:phage terminase small subunit